MLSVQHLLTTYLTRAPAMMLPRAMRLHQAQWKKWKKMRMQRHSKRAMILPQLQRTLMLKRVLMKMKLRPPSISMQHKSN